MSLIYNLLTHLNKFGKFPHLYKSYLAIILNLPTHVNKFRKPWHTFFSAIIFAYLSKLSNSVSDSLTSEEKMILKDYNLKWNIFSKKFAFNLGKLR